MKIAELKALAPEELTQKLVSLKQELSKLNYQLRCGRVEKPHLFRQFKKDIARIKTIIREK